VTVAEVFKQTTAAANKMAGRMGVGLLPGSTQVWDRAAQQLVTCTAQLCPAASNMSDGSYINRVLYTGGGGATTAGNSNATLQVREVSNFRQAVHPASGCLRVKKGRVRKCVCRALIQPWAVPIQHVAHAERLSL
jgi:hypothetical protein